MIEIHVYIAFLAAVTGFDAAAGAEYRPHNRE